jgi:hypothetical protein
MVTYCLFDIIDDKPWENEALILSANQAFQHLAELQCFKDVGIEVKPDWLIGTSVEY